MQSNKINDSKTTSSRLTSTKIKNMTRREFSKVLHTCTSNEKRSIENDNARSYESIVIYPNISSSLLYSHTIKHNSIVIKAVKTKRTMDFHARTVNHISLAADVIEKKDNIYDNHWNIYILNHLTHRHNFHKAVSENLKRNEIEEIESVRKD